MAILSPPSYGSSSFGTSSESQPGNAQQYIFSSGDLLRFLSQIGAFSDLTGAPRKDNKKVEVPFLFLC